MPDHRHGDRLSWGDTVFLYLEREGMPLHIGSASVFEGTIPLQECRDFIASKLPLIPRYLHRVEAPPFNIGLPTWKYDTNFDIRNHVHQVTLERGTDSEFKAVVGKVLSQVMDRRRPLWDFTLVEGLTGNRTGVISRLHHCMADGMAGVSLMNVVMDANPEVPVRPKKKPRLRVPPPQDSLTSVLNGLISSYSNIVDRILAAQSDALNIAERAAASQGDWPAAEFAQLLPELTAPTEPLRFNVTCRGPQKVAWVEIPLGEIKAIREACGTSVNDVFLALVTSAIRRYLEHHGDPVRKKRLRIMVPVNLRGSETAGELGNRISLLPVTVPLDVWEPKRLLGAVHERTNLLKRTHVLELVSLAGGLIGAVATPLQALAGPIVSQLPIAPFNLVCTNVPGPQLPLYLMGHKMLAWFPYVPVGGEMAMNCAILSYNGSVYFGFSGDVHAAPDLWRMEGLLRQSFAELRKAAGVRVPRKPKARRPRKKPPKPVAVASGPVAVDLPKTTAASAPDLRQASHEEVASRIAV